MVWNIIVKLLLNSVPSLSRNGWLPESKDQVSPEGEISLDRAKENMAKLKTTLTSIFQKSFPGFLVYRKCCNLSEDKKDKLPSNSTSLHFRPDLISKLSNSANIEARERGAMPVPRCPLSTWTMNFLVNCLTNQIFGEGSVIPGGDMKMHEWQLFCIFVTWSRSTGSGGWVHIILASK